MRFQPMACKTENKKGNQNNVLQNYSHLPQGLLKMRFEPHDETCTSKAKEHMLSDCPAMLVHSYCNFINTMACRCQRTNTTECCGLCASGQEAASQTRLQRNQLERLRETTHGIADSSQNSNHSSGWPTRYVFLVQLDQRDDKKNKKLK